MRNRKTLYLLMLSSLLILAGCFRDAGDNDDTSRDDVQQVFISTSTPTRTPPATTAPVVIETSEPAGSPVAATVTRPSQIPTFTPAPPRNATNTPAPGGPPIPTREPASTDAIEVTATATREVNPIIPSFTPGSSTFGDPGIVPTEIPAETEQDFSSTPTMLPTDTIQDCIHIVQANDTLTQIAIQYEVSVEEMVNANPFMGGNPNYLLQIGQELNIAGCIPAGAAADEDITASEEITPEADMVDETPAAAATTAAPDGTITYTVQSGDNLFRIALNHNTTVAAIQAVNPELGGGTLIQPGQVLIIPAGE